MSFSWHKNHELACLGLGEVTRDIETRFERKHFAHRLAAFEPQRAQGWESVAGCEVTEMSATLD